MYALIHNSQLILGPIGYNYRLINAELEEHEIDERVNPRSYLNVPLKINENTFLLPITQKIPEYNSITHNVGDFNWNIVTDEFDNPTEVELIYAIQEKSLVAVKLEKQKQITQIRKRKENEMFDIEVDNEIITVSKSREERAVLISKMLSSPGPYNFKFKNGVWLEITSNTLGKIIQQIDEKVQEDFDWELEKNKELENCQTVEEVYNLILEN